MPSHKSNLRAELWEWSKAILFALVTVITIRTFLFEAYTIPTASMENSLKTGDFVLVNKLAYGIRMPMTPLSFPFSHQHLPFTNHTPSYLEWLKIPYYRTAGYTHIKNNDVVVFNYPMEDMYPIDQRTHFIKRCVGVAGDTLEIKERMIYVNGQLSPVPEELQHSYTVETKGEDLDSSETESIYNMGVTQGGRDSKPGRYIFILTEKLADSIRKFENVANVTVISSRKGMHTGMLFPNDENYRWNSDNYGPIYIPQAGATIHLDSKNLPLYQRIIETYERNELRIAGDSIIINGNPTNTYTFKMNYYFMMGDNRHDSEDSRYWGFLPEDHIVGKATTVLLSVSKTKSNLRWNRFFKRVD